MPNTVTKFAIRLFKTVNEHKQGIICKLTHYSSFIVVPFSINPISLSFRRTSGGNLLSFVILLNPK